MSRIFTVARKELWTYFSSPTAYIFLGSYLLITMFTFFWVEKFFSRNIADLRPLFDWMPLLLVFLISTLTMKMWSEERRMGTIEFLLTLPVKTYDLVLGKFFACLAMVGTSLLLTFGLALSVGLLGKVDWGPVFGAYFASLLLAAAYIAIGLFISSRTQSQIVSLILTALICSVLYMIGSSTLANFFGNKMSEVLKLLGTGSRFDSISRGVIDFRDVYYYLSIAIVFLVANTFSLQTLKWSTEVRKQQHIIAKTFVALLILNVLGANFWLQKVNGFRTDLTASKLYSISPATYEVVSQLDEPLLIRGYFSARTHPLLAPLVPTIRDFLKEYQMVAKGKVRTEFVDPRENEELEAEASRKYNIEPAPFQIEDRSSVSMVNSYFNIVVQYGDQFEVLGFDDLIEVKYDGMGHIDVRLRNLEYDITRAIKKTMHAFKNTDSFFAKLDHKIKFVAYVSEDKLPKQLKTLSGDVRKTIEEYKKSSGDKLEVEFLDPSADEKLAKTIAEKYGFMPQAMGILSTDTFYFYLTLEDGDKVYSLGVPQDMSVTGFKHSMDSALKRMMPGFLRNLGLYTPPPAHGFNPMMAQMGGGGGKQFRALQKKLEQSYSIKNVDLDSGTVPSDIDVLLVLAPHEFKDKQIFAIDQFLMKGGSVILSTSPVDVNREGRSFSAEAKESGLEKWLANYGIDIPKELVLDKSNVGFPTMRKRVVQGVTVREPHVAPYPFFADIRDKGLSKDNAITSGMAQLTMAWPSPILVDAEKNKDRKVVTLVESSAHSWRTSDTNIDPNPAYELGFPEPEEKDQKPASLAVLIEGHFDSYFKGKASPLLQKEVADDKASKSKKEEAKEEDKIYSVLEKSPNIARLVLFASNEFVADDTVQVIGMLSGTQYSNPLQLVENAIDWSVQDRTLLAIRSRGHFARTLYPLTDTQKQGWEFFNYLFALMGLFTVWGAYKYTQRKSRKLYKSLNIA